MPSIFVFFNDTATTEIYTLSLHDALPISICSMPWLSERALLFVSIWVVRGSSHISATTARATSPRDRKSTRLNSSHANISYAVFCLKKKNQRPIYAQRSDANSSEHKYRQL